jgi:alpha-L-rhamnosidase
MKNRRGSLEHGIVRDKSTGLWQEDSYQFGDWLDPPSPRDDPGNSITDFQLVANAYLVHFTSLMHKICKVLELLDLAAHYQNSAPAPKTAY